MSGLLGPDGLPLGEPGDVDVPRETLVTGDGYVEKKGKTSGFTKEQRAFIKRNVPKMIESPENLSRSQRQIYAMQQMVMKTSMDNLQLWAVVAAAAEAAGGSLVFTQDTLKRMATPDQWPAITADGDGNVTVTLGGAESIPPDA